MDNKNIFKFLKSELQRGDNTCMVFSHNDLIFSSDKRGVAPLIDFINEKTEHGYFMLADKVIGKAAALLCIKAGIKIVYSGVISAAALEIFCENEIPVDYDCEVPVIENRTKTGLCPMEGLSKGVSSPDEMYNKIIDWMASK
jgi:hypothetical protein